MNFGNVAVIYSAQIPISTTYDAILINFTGALKTYTLITDTQYTTTIELKFILVCDMCSLVLITDLMYS